MTQQPDADAKSLLPISMPNVLSRLHRMELLKAVYESTIDIVECVLGFV
jgi:hypothetical protein